MCVCERQRYDKDLLNTAVFGIVIFTLKNSYFKHFTVSISMGFRVLNAPSCLQEASPVPGSPHLCYPHLGEPKVSLGFPEKCR